MAREKDKAESATAASFNVYVTTTNGSRTTYAACNADQARQLMDAARANPSVDSATRETR
jgi:hypothetical protein